MKIIRFLLKSLIVLTVALIAPVWLTSIMMKATDSLLVGHVVFFFLLMLGAAALEIIYRSQAITATVMVIIFPFTVAGIAEGATGSVLIQYTVLALMLMLGAAVVEIIYRSKIIFMIVLIIVALWFTPKIAAGATHSYLIGNIVFCLMIIALLAIDRLYFDRKSKSNAPQGATDGIMSAGAFGHRIRHDYDSN